MDMKEGGCAVLTGFNRLMAEACVCGGDSFKQGNKSLISIEANLLTN